MQPITVGSVTAVPGARVSGVIRVPAGADPGTEIPVTIISGRRDGHVLALVAGTHGSEPSPIIALQRVRAQVGPAELSGTVTAVQPDQQVAKGALLGRLTDYFGEPVAEITSPMDGMVMYVVVSPAMGKGEPVAVPEGHRRGLLSRSSDSGSSRI